MKVNVAVIKAFSINNTGGNPAGVVFDADGFSNEDKQRIATAAGFAETAFVSQSETADYKLEFFTPLKQIPHCGHATIATFSYLKQTGKLPGDQSSKETIDGNRQIRFKGHMAFMEQNAPKLVVPEDDIHAILRSLNISREDLSPGLQPTIVNTGNSFLVVPVRDEAVLQSIGYDSKAVYSISEKHGLIGYYLYARPAASGRCDATTRMFAPFYGIPEEAATGMAAGPLAAYLFMVEKQQSSRFVIEQGRFMKPASTSAIYVDLTLNDGSITGLYAGGSAHIAGDKLIDIP